MYVYFFLAERCNVVGSANENFRLHRDLCIRVEEETESSLHFARVSPCVNCNVYLDLHEILSRYKNIVSFFVKLYRAYNDVHVLLVRCMRPKDSTNSRSCQTLYNYNTDGKLYCYIVYN